jgi:hypothetical protein
MGKYSHQSRIKKERNDDFIASYKRAGCSLCGYDKCLAAIDFHHVGDNKSAGVSKLNSAASLDRIKREISKCIVVCANCHREIHAGNIECGVRIKTTCVDLPLFRGSP